MTDQRSTSAELDLADSHHLLDHLATVLSHGVIRSPGQASLAGPPRNAVVN